MQRRRYSHLFPDLALLFAATTWGLFWWPLRYFESAGLPAIWVTLVAFSVAFIIGLVFTFHRRHEFLKYPLRQSLVALASGWANAAVLVAFIDGNVVRVVLLFYLSPIWTILLGHLILKERLSLPAYLVFAMSFAGAMIMLWDPQVGFPWPNAVSDWLAISSGFAFALSNVLVRSLNTVSVPVKTTVSWSGGVIVAGLWILFSSSAIPDAPQSAWWFSVLLGGCGIVFMTLCVQYGVTHMPVYRSAVILLFEVVVTTVSAWWIAHETMNLIEWIGGVMVIVSALLLARYEYEAP